MRNTSLLSLAGARGRRGKTNKNKKKLVYCSYVYNLSGLFLFEVNELLSENSA